MTIERKQDGAALALALKGRLDTATAPELEAELSGLDGVTELTLDLKELEYLSSAGLRVILSMRKRMDKQGAMVVRNVNEVVMEIFEVTGFAAILNIQ